MTLVDAIQEQMTGDVLRKFVVESGRSEEEARAATAAALPAILASLSNQILDGPALDVLLRSLRERPEITGGATNLQETDALAPVLGGSLPELVDLLARTTKLDESAVRVLLAALGPVVLDTVAARLRSEGGLDAARLIHVFSAEKPKIAVALPEGLSLADLPSLPGVPTSVPAAADEGPAIPSWLLPALAVVLVVASVWILLKQPVETPEAPKPVEASQPAKGGTPPPPPIERGSTPPAS